MEMNVKQLFLITLIVLKVNSVKFVNRVRVIRSYPCPDNTDVVSVYKSTLYRGYNLTITKNIDKDTTMQLLFDTPVHLVPDYQAVVISGNNLYHTSYNLKFLRSVENNTFAVRGRRAPFNPPYITSLRINGREACSNANLTYLDKYLHADIARQEVKVKDCGRRKVLHTELIVSGVPTKPGEWPWHAAIYKRDGPNVKYICGGTLISNNFVLTAAHCTTKNGAPLLPELFGIILGKYQLYDNTNAEEKNVYKIFVHNEFNYRNLDNDIALLKMESEAVYNDYIQPACLWSTTVRERLPLEALGTVVGWGFDITDALSPILQAANMPMVSEIDCVYSKPEFYGTILQNKRRFCAGFANGTSPCNGDSGGAFTYFIPDQATADASSAPGAWYVRGIVSVTLSRSNTLSLCDRNAYAVFTDVAQYLNWIKTVMA